MSAAHDSLAQHPAPHRDRVSSIASGFALMGGPIGWFLQLCGGYGLASTPCFVGATRLPALPSAHGWTGSAMIAVASFGVVLALLAFGISWRLLQRSKTEATGAHRQLLEIGAGRTRFLALWGTYLSASFGVLTLATFVALWMLPRCAG